MSVTNDGVVYQMPLLPTTHRPLPKLAMRGRQAEATGDPNEESEDLLTRYFSMQTYSLICQSVQLKISERYKDFVYGLRVVNRVIDLQGSLSTRRKTLTTCRASDMRKKPWIETGLVVQNQSCPRTRDIFLVSANGVPPCTGVSVIGMPRHP